MKRIYRGVLPALVCLLTAAPSFAQSEVKVTFHTTFAFGAGAAVLPAGSYSLSEVGNGMALLSSMEGGRSAVIVLTRFSGSVQPSRQSSVSFVQRGGRYYLDTVNLRDGNVVHVNPVNVK